MEWSPLTYTARVSASVDHTNTSAIGTEWEDSWEPLEENVAGIGPRMTMLSQGFKVATIWSENFEYIVLSYFHL